MHLIDLVAMAAVLQYIFFAALVGRARGRHGIHAPAVTGHPMFERAYRVQMNTLELLVALLPAMYAGAHYWPAQAVAAAGAVYVLGRFVYWRAYMREPSGRSLGFLLSMAPVFGLALATLVAAAVGRGAA